MPAKFSGSQWMHTERPIKLGRDVSLEAIVDPELGESPTIISTPISEEWVEPYVVWRLGFHKNTLRPEFNVSPEGVPPLTVVGPDSVRTGSMVHLSATFDGTAAILYVDGREVSSQKTSDIWTPTKMRPMLLQSEQVACLGDRSATSTGWGFVGLMYEVRVFGSAIQPDQIKAFLRKPFPPRIAKTMKEMQGLWPIW